MNCNKKIEAILTAYKNYIYYNHGKVYLKNFNDREKSNPGAAASEALVFNWLYGCTQNPKLNDNPSTGGLDFICSPTPDYQYLVEVTSLDNEKFVYNTGCHMRPGQLMITRLPTSQLFNKVQKKAGQSKEIHLPIVLAITAMSVGSELILNKDRAVDILLSIPDIPNTAHYRADNFLKKSNFIKPDKDDPSKIVSCRQTISAALIIPVEGAGLNIFGILHPDPINVFDVNYLTDIPFVRIKKWPIENDEIHTEWVNAESDDNFFAFTTHIK